MIIKPPRKKLLKASAGTTSSGLEPSHGELFPLTAPQARLPLHHCYSQNRYKTPAHFTALAESARLAQPTGETSPYITVGMAAHYKLELYV